MQVVLGIYQAEQPLPSREASTDARRLLSLLLSEEGLRLPSPLSLCKDEHGRPYLTHLPAGTQIDFNISHAGHYVVVALATSTAKEPPPRIGVDIELPHPHMNYSRIASRFFTSEESATLASASDKENTFLTLWTRKEAYLKYLGTGLSAGMAHFDILSPSDVSFLHYPLRNHPDAFLTLCVGKDHPLPSPRLKFFSELPPTEI